MNILWSNNYPRSDLKPNDHSLNRSTATKMTEKQYHRTIYWEEKSKRTVDGEVIVLEKLGRGPLQAVQRRRSSHTQHPSSRCSEGHNAQSSAIYQSRRSGAEEGRHVGGKSSACITRSGLITVRSNRLTRRKVDSKFHFILIARSLSCLTLF